MAVRFVAPRAFAESRRRGELDNSDIAAGQRISDAYGDRLAKHFMDAWRQIGDSIDMQELERAIAIRSASLAEAAIGFGKAEDATFVQNVELILTGALTAAQKRAGAQLDQARSSIRFDLLNPQAANYVKDHAADLVREVSTGTRMAIRDIIHNGFLVGHTVHEMARDIRGYIGLTAYGNQRLVNYIKFLRDLQSSGRDLAHLTQAERERLLRSMGMRVNRFGTLARTGLTAERIRELAAGYQRRLIAERATTIARHETMDASNAGQNILWQQAIDNGLLRADEWERVWLITGDRRTCPRCIPMRGQTAPIGGNYSNGVQRPPLHIICRCAERLRRKQPLGELPPLKPKPAPKPKAPAKPKPASKQPTPLDELVAAFEAAPDLATIQMIARKQWPGLATEFAGADVRVIGPIMGQYARLAADYPAVAKTLKAITTKPKQPFAKASHIAHADPLAQEIALNPDWVGNRALLMNSVKSGIKSGWFPKSIPTDDRSLLTATFAHEFGHVIDFYLKRLTVSTLGGGPNFDGRMSVSALFNDWQVSLEVDKIPAPSTYGKSHRAEAFAEAFAELRFANPSRWSDMAREQARFLKLMFAEAHIPSKLDLAKAYRHPDRDRLIQEIAAKRDNIIRRKPIP